ncbi:MAG: DUF4271 domain-containing protein, partial [Bacteroidota bacterium]
METKAQEGKNPFDLKHRKEVVEAPNQPMVQESPSIEKASQPSVEEAHNTEVSGQPIEESPASPDNPFNVKRQQVKSSSPPVSLPVEEERTDEEILVETDASEPTQSEVRPLSNSFKFWTITCLLVLLTLTVTLYNSNISKVYRAFLNDNFLKMVHREQHGSILAFPYLLLYLLFFISAGIFTFLIAQYYGVALTQSHFVDLLTYIGLIALLFALKHLTLNIISQVFPISKDIKQYSFTIVIFGIILGLLLIPASVFIAFASSEMTKILIYGTFVVIFLLYLF